MNSDTRPKPFKHNNGCNASHGLDQQHLYITLFVYGTLKRGYWNHDRFCRNAIDIKPATTWGRLYLLPAGYPAIEVPESAILAYGTDDPLADASTQARMTTELSRGLNASQPNGDWDLIQGDLITFADPVQYLPAIDQLEGFHPASFCFYHRIAVTALSDRIVPAWIYSTNTNQSAKRISKWP